MATIIPFSSTNLINFTNIFDTTNLTYTITLSYKVAGGPGYLGLRFNNNDSNPVYKWSSFAASGLMFQNQTSVLNPCSVVTETYPNPGYSNPNYPNVNDYILYSNANATPSVYDTAIYPTGKIVSVLNSYASSTFTVHIGPDTLDVVNIEGQCSVTNVYLQQAVCMFSGSYNEPSVNVTDLTIFTSNGTFAGIVKISS
jgi:hypothetical protein